MEQLDFFNTLKQTKAICPVCGNSFEKTKLNHICCSPKCYNKKWNILNKDKRKIQKKELYDKTRKKERILKTEKERKKNRKSVVKNGIWKIKKK
jgi:hypothetical protein